MSQPKTEVYFLAQIRGSNGIEWGAWRDITEDPDWVHNTLDEALVHLECYLHFTKHGVYPAAYMEILHNKGSLLAMLNYESAKMQREHIIKNKEFGTKTQLRIVKRTLVITDEVVEVPATVSYGEEK